MWDTKIDNSSWRQGNYNALLRETKINTRHSDTRQNSEDRKFPSAYEQKIGH